MKKKNLLLGILFLLTICVQVFSQNKKFTVTGTVTNGQTNAPFEGVSVAIKGGTTGTSTDKNGKYTITAKDGKFTLVFSYSGFERKEIPVNDNTVVDATLVFKKEDLDDVVVVGYQTVKRKDVLASVSSVSAKDLKDVPINSVSEALNGRLAGVTATTSEGAPDAKVNIRVRGGGSITQDNSPLYVIDGVQVENGLSSLVMQDIQSIDVLKDAAATAIYGARGANGVIIVTTKSGRPGKLVVSYNGFVGIKNLPKTLAVLSPYEMVINEYERTRSNSADSATFAQNYGSTWDTLSVYKKVTPVNWQKQAIGLTGYSQAHNVSVSGGTKKTTFNFGYANNNDHAIVLNSLYKRDQFSLRLDHKLTKQIKIGLSARYFHQNVYGAGTSDDKGSSYARLRNAVKYRPFLSASQTIDDPDPTAAAGVGNGLSLINPILLANSEYRLKTTDGYNASLNIGYDITKQLSFRTIVGYEYNKLTDRQFSDSLTPYSTITGAKKPIVQLDTTTTKTLTNSNVFTYSLKNIRNKHDLDVLVGEETYQLETTVGSGLFGGFANFTSPQKAFGQTSLGTPFAGYPKVVQSKYTSLSFFGRINYDFLKKYYFTVNFRGDGSSKFGDVNKWGYFPSASVAWRVKNESFLKNVRFISDMKFRAGIGNVGNNRISDYLYLTTFNYNTYYYGLNGVAVPAYSSSNLVNPNLKWETTTSRNLGLDLSFLQDRINLTVDYYSNSTKDLLLNVPVASTYGYSTQLQNIGKTSNKGFEIQLNSVILRKANGFNWSASFNLSTNKNRIDALGTNQKYYYPAASWGVSGQPTDYIVRIGDPVGAMWGLVTDGFYKVSDFDYNAATSTYTLKTGVVTDASIIGTPQPGSIRFKDLNGDGKVDLDNDRQVIGNPTPKFTGGINQQFSYKNWDMSIFFNFSYGNQVYNANKIEFTNDYTPNSNLLAIMQNRWRTVDATGKTVTDPTQLAALNANATIWKPLSAAGAFYPHSWAIEDGSFLRLNNMTIGYSISPKALRSVHMSRLRFYITGNNLALFTSYTGYDPEVSVRKDPTTPALDYSAYPKSRSFIFGINASF